MSFPGQLGKRGYIQAVIRDSESPYDMLSGAEIQDIDLAGKITGILQFHSQSSDGSAWYIVCALSTVDPELSSP